MMSENKGIVRLEHVSLEMTQADLADAINGLLPSGYDLRHLHITPGGVLATLGTPMLAVDVQLTITQGRADDMDDDEVCVDVRLSKWISVPGPLLAKLLQRALAGVGPAVRLVHTSLLVDLHQLLQPHLRAERIALTFDEGKVMAQAHGVNFSLPMLASSGFAEVAVTNRGAANEN